MSYPPLNILVRPPLIILGSRGGLFTNGCMCRHARCARLVSRMYVAAGSVTRVEINVPWQARFSKDIIQAIVQLQPTQL